MKSGDKVMVYQDPITCKKIEGEATVVHVHKDTGYNDEEGNRIFRCNVRFPDDTWVLYAREVSRLA